MSDAAHEMADKVVALLSRILAEHCTVTATSLDNIEAYEFSLRSTNRNVWTHIVPWKRLESRVSYTFIAENLLCTLACDCVNAAAKSMEDTQ